MSWNTALVCIFSNRGTRRTKAEEKGFSVTVTGVCLFCTSSFLLFFVFNSFHCFPPSFDGRNSATESIHKGTTSFLPFLSLCFSHSCIDVCISPRSSSQFPCFLLIFLDCEKWIFARALPYICLSLTRREIALTYTF